ncbi:unnamed protein product [[Candida] boidinii]|uniref:Unnamed protein product n=1 Tax=Candida boidinii TaxID=5477 RepID=A0ACB5U3E3_CANBO|nr:unnamed protein product [[Candida] boidinii]
MSDIDPSSTTNTANTENTANNNNNNIPDDESSKIVKEWGLSKLYGIERCIFEILIDNGSISGVTLF